MRNMISTLLVPALYGSVASGLQRSPPLVDCKYAVELLHLQDTTQTFQQYRDTMVTQMTELIAMLSEKYDGSRFAFSTFADKPVTFLGIGPTYGCYGEFTEDHCYINEVPFTSNATRVIDAIKNVVIYAGSDTPEAQLEGLIRAAQDPSVQWGSSSEDVEVVKIMVMITDDEAHTVGHVAVAASDWAYYYGYEEVCQYYMNGDCKLDCYEAGGLRQKIEAGTATNADKLRFKDIESKIGSSTPPTGVPHPGSGVYGNDGCAVYEYPSIEQVVEQVDKHNIKVIVLHAGGKGADQYRDLASRFADGVYLPMSDDASDVATLIDQAVAEILSRQCYGPDPTTDESGEYVPLPTVPIVPTEPTVLPGDRTTTASAGNGGESTETTEAGVLPPPVAVVPPPSGGGPSTGIIIGSAAAGVAVIAGAATWFTGGFGMMGGSSSAATSAMNAEVPEAPIEREVAEAIEMDMFA